MVSQIISRSLANNFLYRKIFIVTRPMIEIRILVFFKYLIKYCTKNLASVKLIDLELFPKNPNLIFHILFLIELILYILSRRWLS